MCACAGSHVSLRILRCSKASRPREFSDISTSRPSMMSNRKGRALTMTLWVSAPRDRTTPFSSWDRRDRLRQRERGRWEEEKRGFGLKKKHDLKSSIIIYSLSICSKLRNAEIFLLLNPCEAKLNFKVEDLKWESNYLKRPGSFSRRTCVHS